MAAAAASSELSMLTSRASESMPVVVVAAGQVGALLVLQVDAQEAREKEGEVGADACASSMKELGMSA